MKENIKKFKEEKRKLEQSDALKQARKKFVCFFTLILNLILFLII